MNTRFLETLIVLARVGSFRETAEALHVTQTAVSQRIANLEDDLDLHLLDRSSRQLKLTVHGEQVVEQARKILHLEKSIRMLARNDQPSAGPVHVGVVETVVKTWLSQLIQDITAEFPLISLAVTVDTSRNLQDLFTQKKIDLMIQDMPFLPAIGSTDYMVCGVCDYPLAWVSSPALAQGKPSFDLSSLADLRVLTFSRFSLPHANLQTFLADRGLEEVKIENFPSVESILQLLQNSYGVAAIPPAFILKELQEGSLVLQDWPTPLPISMSLFARRSATKAVHEVFQHARRSCHVAAQSVNQRAGQEWILAHDPA
ncbi:LysR family transcriptional regulator [Bordetella tumulicola]|uniref:LysR family transcriptional regulator n=1 Tax=Bordetella tumulicola TaxID=1649133 RepID=UPI0039F0D191